MNKILLISASLLMAFSLPAGAKRITANSGNAAFNPPASLHMPTHAVRRINRQLAMLAHDAYRISAQQKMAAGNDVLLATSDYDYTQSPGAQFADSQRIIYSNGRGSAYDFLNLYYPLDNLADYPDPSTGSVIPAYVRFDTVYDYPAQGAAVHTLSRYRVYDAAGRVIQDEDIDGQIRTLFTYNTNGQLIMSKTLEANNFGVLDTAYRDFYLYNNLYNLVKDSAEDYAANVWTPGTVINYNLGSNGYAFRVDFITYYTGTPTSILSINNTFNTGNQIVKSITTQFVGSPVMMRPAAMDTLTWTGLQLTRRLSLVWDTLYSRWNVQRFEYRRLNAAGHPDSINAIGFAGYSGSDTGMTKITYDSYSLPHAEAYYAQDGMTKIGETFYYYTLPTGVNAPPAYSVINLYPNPATNTIYAGSLKAGHYNIINAAGQAVAAGDINTQNAGISIAALPCGGYLLLLESTDGSRHAGRFIKE